MPAPELGPWEPLNLGATVEVFRAAPFRWWIAGGRALELHLGRCWRQQDDTDVGMLRRDLPALRPLLAGWDVHVAAAGVPFLSPELQLLWKSKDLRDKDLADARQVIPRAQRRATWPPRPPPAGRPRVAGPPQAGRRGHRLLG